jgi:hypothetical protein
VTGIAAITTAIAFKQYGSGFEAKVISAPSLRPEKGGGRAGARHETGILGGPGRPGPPVWKALPPG